MSDQQNLLDLLEEIKAVPEDSVVYSFMPYAIFIDEAEGLHTRASLDFDLLKQYNMTTEKINRLLVCTGALRTAQSNWMAKQTEKKKAMEAWNNEAPELFSFRDDLLDHLEFALRNDKGALQKLQDIKEGTSRADAIQDLANLAVLGRENAQALINMKYDISLLDQATAMSDHMGTLLGEINGRMYFEDDLKLVRDKAYTLCHAIVEEIRSYGKFVFRKDVEKQKAYTSKYQRERMAAYRGRLKEEESTFENN
eukprot:TRINITY_DN5713_c0_g1_i1.p1 TRINITY_DN5713_c0_g1~~TRINITY_DN5713_c0_g1_i1.p1  ORF type:complete len:253 (+),score=27.48 TRINITY_DN5713_c0_g1_i1:107-865(+)